MSPLLAAAFLALACAPAEAYRFQAPPPLSPKLGDYEKYFNLGFVDGHQQDTFTRRVQFLYNNLEGKGAIRDGIRNAENAILLQPGGQPDPVQSSLLRATVGADSAAGVIYELLRIEARKVDAGWNKVRDAKAATIAIESDLGKSARNLEKALRQGSPPDIPSQQSAILSAIEAIKDSVRLMDEAGKQVALTRGGVTELLPRVTTAARWHADSHKAAGGNPGTNPTETALNNLAGAVRSATGLGEKVYAVMGQIQDDSRQKLLAAAKADALVQTAAAAVRKAAATGTPADRKAAARVVAAASEAAHKGAGAKAGCAACAAKAAARAFGSKDEAESLPELRPFTPRVDLGKSAFAITADGERKVNRGNGKLRRRLKFGRVDGFDGR
jgi:hypothetical protein